MMSCPSDNNHMTLRDTLLPKLMREVRVKD